MSVDIAVAVEAGDWPDEGELERIAQSAVAATAAVRPDGVPDGELSILFTDDKSIAKLNRDWRGKPKPTNVLSFPAPAGFAPPGEVPPLGDIVLAFETITAEAADAGLTMTDHLTHLLVHGLLHLLGHDHVETAEAEAMERLEVAVLATLGIADPYAGADPVDPIPAGNVG